MHVSVETLGGLERKITVSVPTAQVEEEVSLRLKNLAHKAKIDGFRPGKIPFDIVKKRFGESVLQEVARDLTQSTLHTALKEKELIPAGYPFVEPLILESGKDFTYSATFEVFPSFTIQELDKATVEILQSSVDEKDVQEVLEKLREQNKIWEETNRPIIQGDKANIDFEGSIDNKPFDGGKADDFSVIIGSNSMIPGFEDGLIGKQKDEEFDLEVAFPKDYGHQNLAGKDAVFKIRVKQVLEGQLPALDDDFAKKFNIDGGIETLGKDVKQNIERELKLRLSSKNRESVFNKLLEKNSFDLPKALVDQEIEQLKHDMFHRIFGQEHKEDEKIPDFPRSLFEEQATRRVHLGLLLSEYVKHHKITAEQEQIDAMIEQFATAYENPDELRSWYRGNTERLAEIEALVIEEMAYEKILQDAKVIEKTISYDEVMNPKQEPEKEEA